MASSKTNNQAIKDWSLPTFEFIQFLHVFIHIYTYMCVCAHMTERERGRDGGGERERQEEMKENLVQAFIA